MVIFFSCLSNFLEDDHSSQELTQIGYETFDCLEADIAVLMNVHAFKICEGNTHYHRPMTQLNHFFKQSKDAVSPIP